MKSNYENILCDLFLHEEHEKNTENKVPKRLLVCI